MAERDPRLPLSFRGLVASAFGFYRSTLRRLAPASLVLGVILFWLPLAGFGLWRTQAADSLWVGIFIARESLFQLFASILIALGASLIASDLVGLRRSLADAYRGLHPLRTSLLGAALYSMLLGGFAHLVPFLGLILPLVLLGPPALAQVVVVEERPLAEARPRARALLTGELLRTITYLLPVVLLLRLLEGILYSVALGVASGAGWGGGALALLQGGASAAFMGVVMVPFLTALMAAHYLDLRTRAGDIDEDALDDARRAAANSAADPT
ncbi:MAG: hypothetical protein M3454_16650 [Actinomycetota bacterium]|nr:hypothetical protein [Actinomycetota bacterium]